MRAGVEADAEAERVTRRVLVQAAAGSQTRFAMPITDAERIYTIEEVKRFPDSADLGEARGLLSIHGTARHLADPATG